MFLNFQVHIRNIYERLGSSKFTYMEAYMWKQKKDNYNDSSQNGVCVNEPGVQDLSMSMTYWKHLFLLNRKAFKIFFY